MTDDNIININEGKKKRTRRKTGVFVPNKKTNGKKRVKKLTDKQWENVRNTWQADPREGVKWLADKYGVGVMTVSRRRKTEEWTKNEGVDAYDGHEENHKNVAAHKNSRLGRPSGFKEEYGPMMVAWFKEHSTAYRESPSENDAGRINLIPARPPNMARFAAEIGFCKRTLMLWAYETDANDELVRPDFFNSYQVALSYQEAALLEGGIVGAYAQSITQIALKNHHHYQTFIPEPQVGKGGGVDTDELDQIYEKALEEAAERQKAIEGRFERLVGNSASEIQDAEFRQDDDDE